MSKRKALTVAELKEILIAKSKAEQASSNRLTLLMYEALGAQKVEETPEAIALGERLRDWSSGLIARRLKRGHTKELLISSADFVKAMPFIFGNDIDPEVQQMLVPFLKNTFDLTMKVLKSRKNAYDEYWRWVRMAQDIASERGLSPMGLLTVDEGALDEITRRLCTKRQLVATSRRSAKILLDVNTLKKLVIQPLFEAMKKEAGDATAEELSVMQDMFDEMMMPGLEKIVETNKVVVDTWINEEVARIYGKPK